MWSEGDALALAALVVSLIALINTLSQVLQQYFATADGFRRCNSSVLGEWARFTRRKFIWRELRFETLFAAPVIFLEVAYELQDTAVYNGSTIILDGTDEMSSWPGLKIKHTRSRQSPAWSIYGMLGAHRNHPKGMHRTTEGEPAFLGKRIKAWRRDSMICALSTRTAGLASSRTNTSKKSGMDGFLSMDYDPHGNLTENEPVSWIPLMEALQLYAASLRSYGLSVFQDVASGSLRHGRVLSPAIRLRKMSWDFMPPEVLKPYATTNIRDLAICMQLLGLEWTTFKPEEGNLRAEGDGISLTSADVHSLGTLVTFVKTDTRIETRRRLHGMVFSPLEGAAGLGFGMMSSDLMAETYKVYTIDDCQETICRLGNIVQDDDIGKLPRSVLETVMLDILGILTPILRPSNTSITYIVKPVPFTIEKVVCLRGSLAAFTSSLESLLGSIPDENHPSTHPPPHIPITHQILRTCRSILANSKWRAENGSPILAFCHYSDTQVLVLLNQLHKAWRDASSWLTLRHEHRQVLTSHVRATLSVSDEIQHIQRQSAPRSPQALSSAREELLKLYFDRCLQTCVDELHGRRAAAETLDRTRVTQLWVAMVFRGVVWHAMHNFDEKVVAVPPRYHDSNLPVHVA